MSKKIKNSSCKSSASILLVCILTTTTVIFDNSVIAYSMEVNKVIESTSSNITNVNYPNDFIIDAPVKFYNDIKKIGQIINFKFKVPDYFPNGNKVEGFQVRKLSEKDNTLEMFFASKGSSYSFVISKREPAEILEKIENEKTKAIENSKVASHVEPMKLGDIKGLTITLTTTLPARQIADYYSKESNKSTEYFAWKDGELWYSLEYYSTSKSEESNNELTDISQDDIIKIVKSINFPENTKNVNYEAVKEISIENPIVNIYDKDDLDNAKILLGFNPKFPLNINKDVKITGSIVGVSEDYDVKNNIINYQLNNFYSNKNGSIIFKAQKNSKIYEDIKKNGGIDINGSDKQIISKPTKIETLNINNNEVYKYTKKGIVSEVNYLWKEDNLYNSVDFFVNVENSDDIVKAFVNSKPLD